MTARLTLLATAALALSACATTPPVMLVTPPADLATGAEIAPPIAAPTAASEHAKMFALFTRTDEDSLRRNPMFALYRGDLRYADHLGDFITDDYFAKERAAAERDLAELQTVDRAMLSPVDRIAFGVFDYQTRDTLRGYAPDILALTRVRPMSHFYGMHKDYATDRKSVV